MPHRSKVSLGSLIAILTFLALLTLVFAAAVGFGDSPDRRIVLPEPAALHPAAVEIQSLRDAQAALLRELEARTATCEDPEEARALQRRIQQAKIDFEIAMYRIQLRHAESRGDPKTAAVIREVLAAYDTLGRRRAGESVDLPAPDAGTGEVAP